jgi:hypothetical protein
MSIRQFLTDIDIAEGIPEFFYLPELFMDRELPHWCSSAVDFVNQNVSALESEEVSNALHKWIDLIWGVDQQRSSSLDISNRFDPRLYSTVWDFDIKNPSEIDEIMAKNGQIPITLFTGPHPARFRSYASNSIDVKIIPTNPSSIRDLHISGTTLESLKITSSHSGEKFYRHQLPAISVRLELNFMVRWLSIVQFVPDGELPSFVFVPISSNVLYFYDFAEKKIKSPQASDIHMSDIILVTVGASAIVSASRDGIVFSWTHSLEQTGRLFVHHAQVLCMFVSDDCSTVATCDASGKMAISLLPELSCINGIELHEQPKFCLVTAKRGFILVFFENRCRNFTFNGTDIREKTIEPGPKAVCCMRHQFAMITKDDVLAIYDSYSLDKVRVVYRHPGGLLSLKYRVAMNMFVVVRGDHSLAVVLLVD